MTKQYKFCPNCGTPTEDSIAAARTNDEAILRCLHCRYVDYQHSYPTAGAIIEDVSSRVLLVRRSREPFAGYWEVPGGFLLEGEHPEEGARREIREELGIEIVHIELLGIYMDTYAVSNNALKATLNIFYLSRISAGEPVIGDEISQFEWFSRNSLPENIAFANNRLAIQEWLKNSSTV